MPSMTISALVAFVRRTPLVLKMPSSYTTSLSPSVPAVEEIIRTTEGWSTIVARLLPRIRYESVTSES